MEGAEADRRHLVTNTGRAVELCEARAPEPGWVTPRGSPSSSTALPTSLPPGRARENEQRPGNEAVGGRGPGRMIQSQSNMKALLIYFIFNLKRLITLWKQRLFYVKPQNP